MSISAAVSFQNLVALKPVALPGFSVELVVHIDEDLNEDRRYDVKMNLERSPGVRAAKFATKRHHLLLVSYDRRIASSSEILDLLRSQHLGAQLVGPM